MAKGRTLNPRKGPRQIIRLAARQLGSLALADACARCFWHRLKVGNRLPFQIFPGIFSSIDSYTKRIVHGWFDGHGCAPPWLDELGVVRYAATPHWRHFNWVFEPYGIEVAGTPDDLLVRSDESIVIPDYKTARFTETQDHLKPEYEVQLNCYAQIAGKLDYGQVSELDLVYLQPRCDCDDYCDHCNEGGFEMMFDAKIVRIERQPNLLGPLMERAREIYEMTEPPVGRFGCKDCTLLEELVNVVIRRSA